ncbi:hypothetical protein, partial [Streptomyces pathocidini]|uniref:hypothetical protein n=1 Tax=Streptomyces pathocidini TaxID=1650571 RepID=UPI0006E23254
MNSDRDVNSATPARDPHWVLSGCTAVRQAGGLRRGRECDLGRVERGRVALRWVAALRRAVRWPGLVVAVLASVAGAVLVLISAGGRRRVLSGCTAV